MKKRRIQHRIAYFVLTFAAAAPSCLLHAQRLPTRIDSRSKTILRGSRNAHIDGLVSEGSVDDTMRIHGMTFRFQPTPAQSAELERLLEEQQDLSSTLYHAWLTPEQYGERFGLNSGDMTKVAEWIASQGFQIDFAAKSQTHISFSGTAAQVREAFGTELHRYRENGKAHFANTREIMIPAQLEPLVYGLSGLDDFPRENSPRLQSQVTYQDGSQAVTPGDLAVIYNITPLFKKGINGAGQRIAVAGRSAFNMQDVRDFRDLAGLPPIDPKIVLMPGSKDPGYTDDIGEALLDVEYAGAAAPAATIIYVYGTAVELAAQYAIDQNLAPVLSFSFAACERKSQDSWVWWRNLAQQAAAQGITWVACTGDTGAAGCELQSRDSAGISGVSAKLPATVPEVTAVGGTTFAEGTTGRYWSSTTQDDGTSALSYIPEVGWNDTAPGKFLNSSGGGISVFFARPIWQTGPGVPNDNARHIPDVSFTASGVHDPYLMVETGGTVKSGGTSASTPFFAGVLALLNQYVVSNGIQVRPGLGNINPRLYQLAQTTRGVFHDVTAGNNIVPCKAGTSDCTTGQYGYTAGTGYDDVTGLGSLDVASFVENWAAAKSTPISGSVVVPSVEPSPVYQQAPDKDGYGWYYTVKLTETGGAATTIKAFLIDDYDLSDYIADWFGSTTLPANASVSVDLRSKNQNVPSDHVFAVAGVDASGQRWAKQITVPFRGPKPANPAAAISLTSDPAVVVKAGKSDPGCAPDHPYGQTLNLKELNGAAVKLTKFVAAGNDYSNRIAAWFGSDTLPASGALKARLCWQVASLPVTLDYEVDGVDGSGRQVQATVKVEFKDIFDQKSGAVFPEQSGISGWPGRSGSPSTVAQRTEARRRAALPHQTPSGMTVGPRSAVGSASAPVK